MAANVSASVPPVEAVSMVTEVALRDARESSTEAFWTDRFPSAPLDFLYSTWIAFPMGGFIP